MPIQIKEIEPAPIFKTLRKAQAKNKPRCPQSSTGSGLIQLRLARTKMQPTARSLVFQKQHPNVFCDTMYESYPVTKP